MVSQAEMKKKTTPQSIAPLRSAFMKMFKLIFLLIHNKLYLFGLDEMFNSDR